MRAYMMRLLTCAHARVCVRVCVCMCVCACVCVCCVCVCAENGEVKSDGSRSAVSFAPVNDTVTVPNRMELFEGKTVQTLLQNYTNTDYNTDVGEPKVSYCALFCREG